MEEKVFLSDGLDNIAKMLVPPNEYSMMRWIGGTERNYENIKRLVEKVAQDERSTTRQTEPLGPADVLAAVGQNWTTGPGGTNKYEVDSGTKTSVSQTMLRV